MEHIHTATKATAATSAQRELVLGASSARTIVPNKDEFLRHVLLTLAYMHCQIRKCWTVATHTLWIRSRECDRGNRNQYICLISFLT